MTEKDYIMLARQKFNYLFPALEGPKQSVIMSFDGGGMRFQVYREITRRVGRDGRSLKPTRRVVVRKLP